MPELRKAEASSVVMGSLENRSRRILFGMASLMKKICVPFITALVAFLRNILHFSQLILISFSKGLNSGSPVTSSALVSLASAAAKASA